MPQVLKGTSADAVSDVTDGRVIHDIGKLNGVLRSFMRMYNVIFRQRPPRSIISVSVLGAALVASLAPRGM